MSGQSHKMAVRQGAAVKKGATARYFKISAACVVSVALFACGNAAKVPDWQGDAKTAADRYVDAQLKGNARAAQAEFELARRETASTGRPDWVARIELLRCAVQVASLNVDACSGFDALRPDAAAPELAYADYLAGHAVSAEALALLPAAQQGVSAQTVAGVADPLSRLVAAGVLLRRGQASPDVVQLAVDTASAQGWRRPLLAWLGVQAQQAQAQGDAQRAQALRRRMDLVAPQAKADHQVPPAASSASASAR